MRGEEEEVKSSTIRLFLLSIFLMWCGIIIGEIITVLGFSLFSAVAMKVHFGAEEENEVNK